MKNNLFRGMIYDENTSDQQQLQSTLNLNEFLFSLIVTCLYFCYTELKLGELLHDKM